ncbi:MAG: hypothetical protein H6741_20735 [Alphaproteobacteria bacterium]|nr:hypothetical protein [Alphaproteobacteria bacterium]MCB9795136.1 hypothetical protein [Alphaproteobacteria bacterium]
MSETLQVSFPGAGVAPVAQVGGKAASLMRLLEAGLPVPPGVVLTTGFFAPWVQALQATEAWAALRASPPEAWPERCEALKAEAAELSFTEAQEAALAALKAALPEAASYAVRSSSPEEDLATASFAGGYETTLGVTRETLEAAVALSFLSCLDARVLLYKRHQGLDPFAPSVAVVVQVQLDSEVAGVAFSIHPVRNDYDELVVDASWGLGESVVSGAVSPDHFVVDRLQRAVIERRAGEKQRSLRLAEGGGVEEREPPRERYCLSDAQLIQLTEKVLRVEQAFGCPVDVEFAFADGALHLLQARPITAWIPLPPELRTGPGAPRRLYLDIALAGGLTINAPISPMGLSFMQEGVGRLVDLFLGELGLEVQRDDALWVFAGGRMYQDLSNSLWMNSPAQLERSMQATDALVARTLGAVEPQRYRSGRRPVWLGMALLRIVPRAYWNLRRLIWNLLKALWNPAAARTEMDALSETYEAKLRAADPAEGSFQALRERWIEPVFRHVMEQDMPRLAASMVGTMLLPYLLPEGDKDKAEALTRGFPDNVVVRMGVALHRVAGLLPPGHDPESLAEALRARTLPAPALEAWDAFVREHGIRGPSEMDLATPRYGDAPELAAEQLVGMMGSPFDPAEVLARHAEQRARTFEAVAARAGGLRRRLLGWAYRLIDRLSGVRDTPKQHALMLFDLIRRRALLEGQRLVEAGRLERPEQVFELEVADLDEALANPALDLSALRAKRTAFFRTLQDHVVAFPAVIDSRGRVLRPPPAEAEPGTLVGVGVSSGLARGRAKVLSHPREKPVEEGEVLIAHTTDPGWTPLFIHAAAVVMEVGGVMQHGVVVAREFGKPCVVGVPDLLRSVKDGQLVEVDGGAGVLRILDEDGGAA